MKPGFGLVFGLLALVALLGVQPWLWSSVFTAASAFRDRQTQHVQLASVRRLTEEIRLVDEPAQALLDQAAVAYPAAVAAPQVVERLEALAEAQGLTLQLTSITEIPTLNKVRKLTPFAVNLIAVGSPRALLAFFDAVEHMQEFALVEKWEIKEATPVYSLSMPVTFFLQPK